MAMTMTEKILARAAGKESVAPGELIMAKLDFCFGNDVTAGVAIDEFEKAGFEHVFDPEKIALIPDHFTPNKDISPRGWSSRCASSPRSTGWCIGTTWAAWGWSTPSCPSKAL